MLVRHEDITPYVESYTPFTSFAEWRAIAASSESVSDGQDVNEMKGSTPIKAGTGPAQ